MKRVKQLLKLSLVPMLALCGAGQSQATLYYEWTGAGAQESQTFTLDGTTKTEGVGELTLQQTTGIGAGATLIPGTQINTVCLDALGTVSPQIGTTYEQVTLNSSAGLDPKWGNPANAGDALRAIENAAQIFGNNSVAAGSSPALWASLQLAVWEALYDTGATPGTPGLSLATGRFTSSDTAAAGATADLVDGNFPLTLANFSILVPLNDHGQIIDNSQEFLIAGTPVPEPGTVVAGALLLLPFGASTLRFLRKNRTA